MSFLDLFEKDQSIAARPQPNEGTKLPGYYELHREELLIGSVILIVAVLLIAAFHYRTHLSANNRPSGHSQDAPEGNHHSSTILEGG